MTKFLKSLCMVCLLLFTAGIAWADCGQDLRAAIYYGADLGKVQKLLDDGCDANARSSGGMTALMTAASEDKVEMAQLLLTRGANPQLHSDAGRSAADYSRLLGRGQVANLLGNAQKPPTSRISNSAPAAAKLPQASQDKSQPDHCARMYAEHYKSCGGTFESSCKMTGLRKQEQCRKTGSWY